MKMVSAAKLKGDEGRLKTAKAFNSWTTALNPGPFEVEDATYEELPQRVLIVPFSSEKGLCGGVNSYVARSVRDCYKKLSAQGKECDFLVIGDKGRAQLKRSHGEKIIRSATDVIAPGTYSLASGLASELMAIKAQEYDAIVIIYNTFINAATYNQMYKVITPFVTQSEIESLSTYEFDSDKAESMEDLYEFVLASQLFHSFLDAAASEQSSRMTAMENASQNANEMIRSLTLKYNRVRQARITTELIEIISGASAIDTKK
jgi:F-type H+-transporting ATPase subunit gamma